jgi:hypothetical protein
METLRKTELTMTTRVYVSEISELSLLHIHGPVIVKTIEIEVHSEKEENSGVAKVTNNFIILLYLCLLPCLVLPIVSHRTG